jgi:serine protease Do
MHPTVRKIVTGTVLAAGLVGTATGLEVVRAGRAAAPVAGDAGVVGGALDTVPVQSVQAFRRATEQALPGVVHVQVEGVRRARVEVPDAFRGTPWEELFRQGPSNPQPQPRRGSGSGFIFRQDGYILTNNHVIEGAERVTVILQDRREFSAEVVGRDPNTDVAVLKVDAGGLPVVPLGDSDPVAVGDWVVALGYPLQLGSTATAGIVSAKGRRLGIINQSQEAAAPLEHFIQTDAAINPGNSGGPLVDLEGRAIAMNSAIASPTGYYSGYGFAVPINLARRVAEDLITHGEVRRPRLGVAIADLTPADAEIYRLESQAGAAVSMVEPGGPADKAGIQLGDVIVAVDGKPVDSSGALMELLARSDVDRSVALDLVRYGKRQRVTVKLGEFEPAVKATQRVASEREDGLARLGFAAAELTPELGRRLGIEETKGVVIARVAEGGPAAQAGIALGMVVERLNGREVGKLSELEAAARSIKPGQAVSLVVKARDGRRMIINYRTRG